MSDQVGMAMIGGDLGIGDAIGGALDSALDSALEAAFDYMGEAGAVLSDAWETYVGTCQGPGQPTPKAAVAWCTPPSFRCACTGTTPPRAQSKTVA